MYATSNLFIPLTRKKMYQPNSRWHFKLPVLKSNRSAGGAGCFGIGARLNTVDLRVASGGHILLHCSLARSNVSMSTGRDSGSLLRGSLPLTGVAHSGEGALSL